MYFVDVSNRVLDPAQPILILGETPLRRLGIPLAALRGSSDGIWATSIAHHQFTPQSLDEAIVSCHRRCLLNMGLFYTNNMHWGECVPPRIPMKSSYATVYAEPFPLRICRF